MITCIASEGEHGNVKVSDANKRYFIIHRDEPVAVTEAGELLVNFEYRPDPEKSGQEKTWREKRNGEAVKAVLEALENAPQITHMSTDECRRLLTFPAPTEKNKN